MGASERISHTAMGDVPLQENRFKERRRVERANRRLKDQFGGGHLRVCGHAKTTCHLLFGILALTVDPLIASKPEPRRSLTPSQSPPAPER